MTTTPSDDAQTAELIKQVLKKSLLLALGGCLLLVALSRPEMAKGLALGALAAAGNFLIMAAMLPKAVQTRRGKAEAFSLFSIVLRFALMGGALFAAFSLFGRPGIAGAAIGLFSVQAAIMVNKVQGRLGSTVARGS